MFYPQDQLIIEVTKNYEPEPVFIFHISEKFPKKTKKR